MNIIILCGGPPKIGRQRHLEIFNGEPLIKKLIDACSIKNRLYYKNIRKK